MTRDSGVPHASRAGQLDGPGTSQGGGEVAPSGNKAGFIPGPWRVERDDRPDMEWNNHVCFGEHSTVCFMAHGGERHQSMFDATAHLIAAAPDLYAALDEAIDIIFWMSGSPSFSPDGEAHEGWLKVRPKIAVLSAALSRATGSK